MRIVGLDGKYHNWNLKYKKPSSKCSKLHRRARNLLKKLFPFDTIYEEVILPGSRISRRLRVLRADFYIPGQNLLIEVHGQQHYKYSNKYHKTKMDFIESKSRDRDKEQWCKLNHIKFVELPYNENNTKWEKRIEQ